MIDLDTLERLAREALPGPWQYVSNSNGQFIMAQGVRHPNASSTRYADLAYLSGVNGIDEREGNFIAASNPAVVLSLIERIRELEKALAGMLDNFGGYCCPEVDAAITVMQEAGIDRWSMQSQIESVFEIPK